CSARRKDRAWAPSSHSMASTRRSLSSAARSLARTCRSAEAPPSLESVLDAPGEGGRGVPGVVDEAEGAGAVLEAAAELDVRVFGQGQRQLEHDEVEGTAGLVAAIARFFEIRRLRGDRWPVADGQRRVDEAVPRKFVPAGDEGQVEFEIVLVAEM